MNLKNWPIIPFIVIIALVAGLLFWEKSQIRKNKDSEVHYHAGFQVYIDDELQDFSDVKFMHIEPCSEEEHEEETEEHKQIELAHTLKLPLQTLKVTPAAKPYPEKQKLNK